MSEPVRSEQEPVTTYTLLRVGEDGHGAPIAQTQLRGFALRLRDLLASQRRGWYGVSEEHGLTWEERDALDAIREEMR